MTNINISKLIESCDLLSQRCARIADTHHGSSWLFDKLMRTFESSSACTSVTIPVFINAPVMSKGEATVGRDGSLSMRTVKAE